MIITNINIIDILFNDLISFDCWLLFIYIYFLQSKPKAANWTKIAKNTDVYQHTRITEYINMQSISI